MTRPPLALSLVLLAGAAAASPSPQVALLSTPLGAGHTELRIQAADASEPGPVAARLEHLEGAPLRAAVVPRTRQVAVVTDLTRMHDLSFSGSLVILEAGQRPRVLVDEVAHATAPHVLPSGRILVSRGRPGAPGADGGRVDQLTVDEVDPGSGRLRQVASFIGYTAFIAGSLGKEAFVYRVGPQGAELLAVELASGRVRVLSRLIPFARDFSVDAKARALVYANRDPGNPRRWRTERVSLLGEGPATVLAQGPSLAMIPFAWPDGAVTLNLPGQAGLQRASGAEGRRGAAEPGLQTVRWVSADGARALLLQSPPGGSEVRSAWLWEAEKNSARRLAVPPEARVELAGFFTGAWR